MKNPGQETAMIKNPFFLSGVYIIGFVYLATAFLFFLHPLSASANSPNKDSFVKDIRQAVQSRDRQGFWKMINMKGVGEKVKASLTKHLVDPLMKGELLKISLQPLPEDFHTEYAVDGIRYKPNVQPLGLVEFQYKRAGRKSKSTTKMMYGKKGSRYMLAGTVEEKLSNALPPSKQIQTFIMGIGHPAVTFEGYMIYLQGGKPVRDSVKDMGSGNLTRIVRGESITYLEVRRTSTSGTLKVKIMEDGETIFETSLCAWHLPSAFLFFKNDRLIGVEVVGLKYSFAIFHDLDLEGPAG